MIHPPAAYSSHSPPQSVTVPVSRSQLDAPTLERLKNGRYRTIKPWTVDLDGRHWAVPKGYSTNGITCPPWLKSSLGDGAGRPETWAAIFHDWLFTQARISRPEADRLFYDLLIAYGVPTQKAKLMHAAVVAYSLAKNIR